jgi:hypothetical protein
MPCGFLSGFNRRFPRACAGAPGLRSRSYFGGVGSAGRPITFSEPVKSMDVAEGHSEQFNSCYFTPDASRLTNPCGLATGNGVSHAGVGRVRMRAFPCRASGPVLILSHLCTAPGFPHADHRANYFNYSTVIMRLWLTRVS